MIFFAGPDPADLQRLFGITNIRLGYIARCSPLIVFSFRYVVVLVESLVPAERRARFEQAGLCRGQACLEPSNVLGSRGVHGPSLCTQVGKPCFKVPYLGFKISWVDLSQQPPPANLFTLMNRQLDERATHSKRQPGPLRRLHDTREHPPATLCRFAENDRLHRFDNRFLLDFLLAAHKHK